MYNYAENVKRYELLDDALRRADMAGDVHAQSYAGLPAGGGGGSGPVHAWLMRCERIRRGRDWLGACIEGVRELRAVLERGDSRRSEQMKLILEREYFEGRKREECMIEGGMTERTYYRRKRELVSNLWCNMSKNAEKWQKIKLM